MVELWKDITGYENIYQVSNLGRVRSLDRIVSSGAHWKGRLMSQCTSRGYAYVALKRNGNPTNNLSVSRLVAKAFIPNQNSKPQVNYIDENKCNNCVDNLEWTTAKENINHGTGIARRAKKQRYTNSRCRYIKQFTLNGTFMKVWHSVHAAARSLGLKQSNISEAAAIKHRTCGGFRWEYLNTFTLIENTE